MANGGGVEEEGEEREKRTDSRGRGWALFFIFGFVQNYSAGWPTAALVKRSPPFLGGSVLRFAGFGRFYAYTVE